MIRPFHLAFPCADLEQTKAFYTEILGCGLGREDSSWVDLDFFGHQLVFHVCGGETLPKYYNPVDAHQVPLPHFGVILKPADFDALAERLRGNVEFVIEPYRRFKGTPGEQDTMFFFDNNGYALEFKAFEDDRFIFEPFESKQ
jgi:extradiol dioxygenase family protein